MTVIIVYNFRFLFILWFYHIFRLWLAVFVGTWIDCIGAVAESGTVRVAGWVCSRAAADAATATGAVAGVSYSSSSSDWVRWRRLLSYSSSLSDCV